MSVNCALSAAATDLSEISLPLCSPHLAWPPMLMARHKADLAQAHYSESDILDLSSNWAVLCSRCLQWGHHKISCQARLICINCSSPGHKASDCLNFVRPQTIQTLQPTIGNTHPLPEQIAPCLTMCDKPKRKSTVRCTVCGFYGHVERSCHKRLFNEKWQWREKSSPSTHSTPHGPASSSVSPTP